MPSYTRKILIPGRSALEIYERISQAIGKFEAKDDGKFGKFTFDRDDVEMRISLESTYVTAHLRCFEGEVHLDGKLSILAAAFKGKIDSSIDQWVDQAFRG